jgi:hypothetical protein
MKKKVFLICISATILLGLFLAGALVPGLEVRHYYFLIPWWYHRPDIYSMQLRVMDATDEWVWRVVVQGEEVVEINRLSGPEHNSWFKYDFTVDGIYDAGKDFCFKIFECMIRIDSNYFYPKIFAYPPRWITVENFQVCNTVNECLQEK